MNILFNATVCGLGNNGGTKTIIKSGEVLKCLGCGVSILADVNNYTWHKHNLYFRPDISFCGYDTIVSVSVWDVDSTLEISKKHGLKPVWWIRGWEKWVKGEEWLISQLRKFYEFGGLLICNSSWLVDHLRSLNMYSELCFAGLDLNFWKDYGMRDCNGKLTIGGLWSDKHKTKRFDILERVMYHFGDKFNYKILKNNLNNVQLRNFYNECDIWIATSELEGFHQVPAEAALCGCYVIATNNKKGGTCDYDKYFRKYNDKEELICFLNKSHCFGMVNNYEVCRIGDRETNMKKFLELIK